MTRQSAERRPVALLLAVFALTAAGGLAARLLLPRIWPWLETGHAVRVQLAPEAVADLYGFSITNTIAGMAVSTLALLTVVAWARLGRSRAARLLADGLDSLIETGYGIVEGMAGRALAGWLFPVVATLFAVIVANAWMAVTPVFGPVQIADADHDRVPLFRGAGTDINLALALSAVSLLTVNLAGFAVLRSGYVRRFVDIRLFRRGTLLEAGVSLFVGLLHLLTELTRFLSFAFRLFGTLTAGEVLLIVAGFLLPLALSVPFYGLELAIGLVQGAVFAGLTAAFAASAVSGQRE
jgi:F-type H+-transporting ATPase subunit a